jgi:hypothetical protein
VALLIIIQGSVEVLEGSNLASVSKSSLLDGWDLPLRLLFFPWELFPLSHIVKMLLIILGFQGDCKVTEEREAQSKIQIQKWRHRCQAFLILSICGSK